MNTSTRMTSHLGNWGCAACLCYGGISGKWKDTRIVHGRAFQSGFASYLYVANSLMDMYPKCGDAEGASNVFIGISDKDLISWNTMLFGFAMNGWANEALAMYDSMKSNGVCPDEVTAFWSKGRRPCLNQWCLRMESNQRQSIWLACTRDQGTSQRLLRYWNIIQKQFRRAAATSMKLCSARAHRST